VSISGISAASSAAYIQQSQNTIQSGATAAAVAAQALVPAQTGAQQPDATQQAGPVQPAHHHHHRGGGDGAAQATDISLTGTSAAEGTNNHNTLV
jgi:hypothetical protein